MIAVLDREKHSPSVSVVVLLALVGLVCLAVGGGGVWLAQRVMRGREAAVPAPTPSESIPLAPGPDNTITTPPPKPAPEQPAPDAAALTPPK